MLSNYLLIAWRNLLKNKTFSLINILGLAVSLAASVLILLYVHSEFTYDSYHKYADRIIRITSVFSTPEGSRKMVISGEGVGPLLKDELPEVEEFVRFSPNTGLKKVKINDQLVKEENILRVDPQVFNVFSYKLIEGDAATCLSDPGSVVLTQATAEKYFGGDPALGKGIIIDGERLLVSGVMENLPDNVDVKVNAFLRSSVDENKALMKFAHVTYVLLREGTDKQVFKKKLNDFAKRHYEPITGEQFSVELSMQTLKDVHFTSGYFMDTPKGNRMYPLIFSLAGSLLFCLALFNYINLSAIKMLERGREVGIRKTIGARKTQLVLQFITESVVLILITAVFAFTLVQLAITPFNHILEKDFSLAREETFWLVLLAMAGLGCIAALVSYLPARKLSTMPTAAILKGKLVLSQERFSLRKMLILLQFVISGLMVSGVVIIYLQLSFIHKKELGFQQENVLVLDLPHTTPSAPFTFKKEVINLGGISASLVGHGAVPGTEAAQGSLTVKEGGRNDEFWINFISVDEDFFDLFGITLKEGLGFGELTEDERQSMLLVNESFVNKAGLENPVGALIESPVVPGGKGKLAGVIGNYHYASIHNMIEPLVIDYVDEPPLGMRAGGGMTANTLLVKLHPAQVPQIESLYKKFYPNDPVEYRFLDQSIADLYGAESKLVGLFTYLTLIAVLVACLGLFGLSGYMIQLRTKEIGIRKVLGASLQSLLVLLTSEFVLLVLVAQVVAVPLAVWAAERWLDGYAYRIELQWWLFGFSAMAVLLVAVFTVVTKVIQAARTNPVEALRTE